MIDIRSFSEQYQENIRTEFMPFDKNPIALNSSVSIIIVSYNSAKTILKCLKSVDSNIRINDEVFIVDNRSRDLTDSIVTKFISERKRYRLVCNHRNIGYSAAANLGIRNSINPFVILLNPDTVVPHNSINRLLNHFSSQEVGAIGPVSNYAAGLQKISHYISGFLNNLSNINWLF